MKRSDLPNQPRGWSKLLRGLVVDTTPLRVARDFRLLWLAEMVSEAGSQITLVALYVQIYAITDSVAAVGLIGLVQFIPLALTTLVLSPVIDTYDRRKLLLIGQIGQAGAAVVLLVASFSDRPPLEIIYLGGALVAGFGGFSLAVRSAMTPNLVTPEQLPAALTLNQVMWNTCLIFGPAIGGIVIDQFGLVWAYGIDVATFTFTILVCLLIHPQLPIKTNAIEIISNNNFMKKGWDQVFEGFRFLRGRKILQATFYADLIAMVFGMPRALFPVLAVTQFDSNSTIVGLLFAAVSVGALIGALSSGWVSRVKRQGLAVVWSIVIWGIGIVGFGVSGSALGLALFFLALAGAADVISAVFRNTILQVNVPDDLRGRMSGVHILVVAGGPRIGDVEAGLVAALTSPTISVITGGLACIVGVLVLAVKVPGLVRYRSDDPKSIDA